jgi:hypothetical protein
VRGYESVMIRVKDGLLESSRDIRSVLNDSNAEVTVSLWIMSGVARPVIECGGGRVIPLRQAISVPRSPINLAVRECVGLVANSQMSA